MPWRGPYGPKDSYFVLHREDFTEVRAFSYDSMSSSFNDRL